MGLLYGENCTILATTVFALITRVTDGRTDGQTDGRNCDSICTLTAYAVACKITVEVKYTEMHNNNTLYYHFIHASKRGQTDKVVLYVFDT